MSSIRPSILPSSYYPAYFKLDMKVGLNDMNPLARAIDLIFADFHRLNAGELLKISPDNLEAIKTKEILEGMGFKVDELTLNQKDALYKKRLELFQYYNRLQAVDVLASVYFKNYSIQKGWPYRPTRILGQRIHHLRLLEPELEQKVIFLRTEEDFEQSVIDEFIQNSYLFIPKQFKVVVGGQKYRSRPYYNKIRLNLSTKLNTWRL